MSSVASDVDLLSDHNGPYKVLFDIPTPRPHFVFLQNIDGCGFDHWDNQKTKEDEYQLINAVDKFCRQKDIHDATFSLHRGSWVSNRQRFHAHLCVDKGQYLQIFKEKNVIITPNNVTGQWKKSTDPEDYLLNVEAYPFKSYHGQDLADIGKLDARRRNEDLPESVLELVWHHSLPRLGFKLNQATRRLTQADIFGHIEKFAEDLGLVHSSRIGCHVCLVFGHGR